MPRMPLLNDDEISFRLHSVPMWRLERDAAPPNRIVRDAVAPNFSAAVGLINAIAICAETADHHPDILLYGWNKLRITVTTHDSGGLTENDFQLALKIDAVLGM